MTHNIRPQFLSFCFPASLPIRNALPSFVCVYAPCTNGSLDRIVFSLLDPNKVAPTQIDLVERNLAVEPRVGRGVWNTV